MNLKTEQIFKVPKQFILKSLAGSGFLRGSDAASTSSLGGGAAVRRRLLLRLLLLRQRLLQARAFAGVVLPVQQLLLVNELGALRVHQLLPEVLVLQQLQHVQTVRIPAGREGGGGVSGGGGATGARPETPERLNYQSGQQEAPNTFLT